MRQAGNPLKAMLLLLNIKHTAQYTNKYYNEHPHKYNMFGLSNMLKHYGIRNHGIVSVDKSNKLTQLETPFIAHLGGDFAVVTKSRGKLR